jgi:hypothetical protein
MDPHMIPIATLVDYAQKGAAILGIATPIYGGLAYYKLTPVTESYVTAQIETVQKGITGARVDTLETKRTVMGLARSDLTREQLALEGALKIEQNPVALDTFRRRIEIIKQEIENLDRKVIKLDDKIEGLRKDE